MISSLVRNFAYKMPGVLTPASSSSAVQGFIPTTDIYKPAGALEFNTKGEILVYSKSCKSKFNVFFPFPWAIGTYLSPYIIYRLAECSGHPTWSMFFAAYLGIMPHCYYLYNLRFNIDRIWYVRGGAWKIENNGIMGAETSTYMQNDNLVIKKEQEELNETGGLDSNLDLVALDWQEYYQQVENQRLTVPATGTVHNPELFQAMLKKWKVDDSNFVIRLKDDEVPISQ
jgi:hypothetical protein